MADIRDLLKKAASTGASAPAPAPKGIPAGINVAAEAEAVAKLKRKQAAPPTKGYKQLIPSKR